MTEKTIGLKMIDPIDIYGVNNRFIDLFASFFPKMKIVVRGSEIKIKGSEEDIVLFEEKLSKLLEVKQKKQALNEDDIKKLFLQEFNSEDIHKEDGDVIVYGTEGKIVRARTKNQKALVTSYVDNDLIFAIGPAGTGKTYTAIALAVRALKNKEVRRLILTQIGRAHV